jgi:hypothetical protein
MESATEQTHQSKKKDYIKEYNKKYYDQRALKTTLCTACLCDVKIYAMSKHLKSKSHGLALRLNEKYSNL